MYDLGRKYACCFREYTTGITVDNIYLYEQELLKKRNIKVISSYVKTHRHSNLIDIISENCLLNEKRSKNPYFPGLFLNKVKHLITKIILFSKYAYFTWCILGKWL